LIILTNPSQIGALDNSAAPQKVPQFLFSGGVQTALLGLSQQNLQPGLPGQGVEATHGVVELGLDPGFRNRILALEQPVQVSPLRV
jgi:hypothetical protein